ncbi:MAG: AAA family ATPase [Clostridium sp.]
MSYEEESEGTRKLLCLLPLVLKSLDCGGLLLADDLDQALHPHLLRYLISLYKNREKNPHNAQLVFTAHNTAILTPGGCAGTRFICAAVMGKRCRPLPALLYKGNGLIPRMTRPMENSIWKAIWSSPKTYRGRCLNSDLTQNFIFQRILRQSSNIQILLDPLKNVLTLL